MPSVRALEQLSVPFVLCKQWCLISLATEVKVQNEMTDTRSSLSNHSNVSKCFNSHNPVLFKICSFSARLSLCYSRKLFKWLGTPLSQAKKLTLAVKFGYHDEVCRCDWRLKYEVLWAMINLCRWEWKINSTNDDHIEIGRMIQIHIIFIINYFSCLSSFFAVWFVHLLITQVWLSSLSDHSRLFQTLKDFSCLISTKDWRVWRVWELNVLNWPLQIG